MRNGRRSGPAGDRISKVLLDSLESDFARDAGARISAFVTEKPILSTCLGLAAGFVLGRMIRRRD